MKKARLFIATAIAATAISFTAFAGEWKQDTTGWWYENDDGSFTTSAWQVIGGKSYLFDANGYMRTGWIQTTSGNWYYLNPSGEIRYEDLDENGVIYHFDSKGICTNPGENGSESGNELNFNSDYQSILDMERLRAEKRLMDQDNNSQNYEESIVYEHDVAPTTPTNRYGLSDMQF